MLTTVVMVAGLALAVTALLTTACPANAPE
jgi:hypothetical protein